LSCQDRVDANRNPGKPNIHPALIYMQQNHLSAASDTRSSKLMHNTHAVNDRAGFDSINNTSSHRKAPSQLDLRHVYYASRRKTIITAFRFRLVSVAFTSPHTPNLNLSAQHPLSPSHSSLSFNNSCSIVDDHPSSIPDMPQNVQTGTIERLHTKQE
jgi:hypothetical protein